MMIIYIIILKPCRNNISKPFFKGLLISSTAILVKPLSTYQLVTDHWKTIILKNNNNTFLLISKIKVHYGICKKNYLIFIINLMKSSNPIGKQLALAPMNEIMRVGSRPQICCCWAELTALYILFIKLSINGVWKYLSRNPSKVYNE